MMDLINLSPKRTQVSKGTIISEYQAYHLYEFARLNSVVGCSVANDQQTFNDIFINYIFINDLFHYLSSIYINAELSRTII